MCILAEQRFFVLIFVKSDFFYKIVIFAIDLFLCFVYSNNTLRKNVICCLSSAGRARDL